MLIDEKNFIKSKHLQVYLSTEKAPKIVNKNIKNYR